MSAGAVPNPAVPATTIPFLGGAVPGNPASANSAAPVNANANAIVPSTTTTAANPFAAPTATVAPIPAATVPATATSITANSPSLVQSNGINPTASQGTDASDSLAGDFEATYGQGTGTAITDLLSNMGTVDSGAIQATIANTDLAASQQYANIQSGEAASGVTANSSTAALAGGDFYSGVNSQLQQTIGSEEEGEQNTELQTLLGEGQDHGTDESTLDSVMNGVTDAGEIGGAIFGV